MKAFYHRTCLDTCNNNNLEQRLDVLGESGICFLARRTKESTTAVCFVRGRMLKRTVKSCLSIIMATTTANDIDIIT